MDAKTQQAQLAVLVGAGKEMGVSLLRNAQSTAETPEQLSAQVFSTQIAACHILAHCAFNQEKVGGVDGDKWLDNTLEEIKKDLELLRLADERGEMKFHAGKKPEGKKADS